MSVEMTLSRETLCFERLALTREEQVSVEGEATLPGSMRDAVTVLSVQAQAYLEDARATAGGMTLRGRCDAQRARELSGAVYAGGFDANPRDGDGVRL